MFLDRAPEQLDEIRTSLGTTDYSQLRVAAHSLKPQLSYMGIKSLEQDIRNIEDFSGSGNNLDALPALVEKLDVTLRQAFNELQDYINTH